MDILFPIPNLPDPLFPQHHTVLLRSNAQACSKPTVRDETPERGTGVAIGESVPPGNVPQQVAVASASTAHEVFPPALTPTALEIFD